MMNIYPKNKTPLVAARGGMSQLERQLAEVPTSKKKNSPNSLKRQYFCGDCYYFRAVPLERRQRTFCAFTGEKLSINTAACGFYAEVTHD